MTRFFLRAYNIALLVALLLFPSLAQGGSCEAVSNVNSGKTELIDKIVKTPMKVRWLEKQVSSSYKQPIEVKNRELLITLIENGKSLEPYSRSKYASSLAKDIQEKVNNGNKLSRDDIHFLIATIPDLAVANAQWALTWRSGLWKQTVPMLAESKDGQVADFSSVAPGEAIIIKTKTKPDSDIKSRRAMIVEDLTATKIVLRTTISETRYEYPLESIESIYSLTRHAKAFIGHQVKVTRYGSLSTTEGEAYLVQEGILKIHSPTGENVGFNIGDIRNMVIKNSKTDTEPMVIGEI